MTEFQRLAFPCPHCQTISYELNQRAVAAVIAISAFFLLTFPCTGYGTVATIVGKVLDGFGKPVPGVQITLENLDFNATTNANGEYTIGYAPGKVKVLYHKDGYTSDELMMDLATETRVPVKPRTLWQIPPERGIWFVGQSKYLRLERGWLAQYESMKFAEAQRLLYWSLNVNETRRYIYTGWACGSPSIIEQTSPVAFIDNDPHNLQLFKSFVECGASAGDKGGKTGERTILWIGIDAKNGSSTSIVPKEDVERIAKGLVLRRVTLEPGLYAFVTVNGHLLNDKIYPILGEPLYLFEVPGTGKSGGSINERCESKKTTPRP